MKAPPFLLAAALLLWGRETEALWLAAALAAAFEGSRLVARRIEFSLENQNRIADLCTALFAVAAAYTYATSDSADAARLMLNRSPLFFAPQQISKAGQFPFHFLHARLMLAKGFLQGLGLGRDGSEQF